MNTLERHGLLSLLRQAVPHLKQLGYDDVVWNGRICGSCRQSGMGSSKPHADDCAGVRLLRDIEAVLAEVGDA